MVEKEYLNNIEKKNKEKSTHALQVTIKLTIFFKTFN
jgi:hypothetical protein